MARRIRTFLVFSLPLAAVVFLLLWPSIRIEWLSGALSRAESADEAARVAEKLLRKGTDAATRVVADYAAESELRAFDPDRGILLIHDRSSGETHVVYVGLEGEPVDTGDPALDRAITRVVPEITGRSFAVGIPARIFSEVRALEPGSDYVDFVLGPDRSGDHFGVRFTFEGDRLVQQMLYNYKP